MKGLVEILVFTGASAALHLAVVANWSAPLGTAPGAGASGEAHLTLAAATPSLSARVEAWRTAPQTQTEGPERAVATETNTTVATPSPGQGLSVARKTVPAPARPTEDGIATLDAEPPAPPKPPEPKPAPEPDSRSEPAPPRQAETAKGAVKTPGATAGASTPKPAAAAAPAVSRAALANWGSQIRTRIERRKKTPRGSWSPGSTTVRIKITRDGGLAGLGVLKSSGDSRLDRAALDAVKRAGRFPAAPKGFAKPAMTFDLPVSFVR